MSVALNPPSHNLETTLLSYSSSPNSPTSPRPVHPPIQHSNPAVSRSLSPPYRSPPPASFPDVISSEEVLSHAIMDEEPTPASPSVFTDGLEQIPPQESHQVPTPEIDGQDHDRIDIEMEDGGDVLDIPPPPPPPPPPQPPRSDSNTPVAEHPAGVPIPPPNGHPVPPQLERIRSDSISERHPEEDGEDDSEDDSSYEEDSSFWASFQEDRSGPSEEELQEINRRTEISAIDHTHWEEIIYEKVDDPEYTVADYGRIEWLFKGFHGTKEAPNRERVIRSPSVAIGGFNWNIKLLPRGDETTDQVSVYIECTGPVVDVDSESSELVGADIPAETDTEELLIDLRDEIETKKAEKTPKATATTSETPSSTPSWDVAAQIGCLMYNPAEPRVAAHEKSAHHFENGSMDWGWVRFHGPWNTIHQRQHLQRQALLRDDTLAFTAYIRTFNDPTRALWWHPNKDNSWDSMSKTGYRGLIVPDSDASALAAALAAWTFLRPYSSLMSSGELGNKDDFKPYIQPLYKELRKLWLAIYDEHTVAPAVSLDYLVTLLDWYDWDLPACPDVVEIWETLQHLLNKEYYHVGNGEPKTNILSDIVTFRQILYSKSLTDSGFLPENERPKLNEPSTTQEVLNSFLEDCLPNNKRWSKLGGISGFNRFAPSTLQLELHRQDYDIKNRKWKRLTHRIELCEKIVLDHEHLQFGTTEYELWGLVVHAGKLGSGQYYTIIRPEGPGSSWIQFGGVGHDQSHVTRLTYKQAVQAHEGSGQRSEGEAPVAYIAIYVKVGMNSSEMIVRPKPLSRRQSIVHTNGMANGLPSDMLSENLELEVAAPASNEDAVVHVFDSGMFSGWMDRGLMDPIADQVTNTSRIKALVFPKTRTLREVRDELLEKHVSRVEPDQVWIWVMSMLPVAPFDRNRLAPVLRWARPGETVGEASEADGGCRIWFHIVQPEVLERIFPPPLIDIEPEPAPPPPSTEAPAASGTEVAPPTEDVVMGGTQEQDSAVRQEGDDKFWQALRTYNYFFVKRFDSESQRLVGIGSYLALSEEKIGMVLERYNLIFSDKDYDLYSEISARLRKTPISRTSTFREADIFTGIVIIIVDRTPTDHSQDLTKKPQINSLLAHYGHLESLVDPNYQQPRWTSCYFGSLYVSAENKHGPVNGHCIRIETFGDAYFGNCVLGVYSGHGTMYYSNGDTYTGEWSNDLPNGQGKMVYGKTGNVYEGGWKDGKKHGKGVMWYEVADEELEICRICYETEMDALFFRCGHVAACEECARQVKDCPVCRKPVDAVVKIYRT